MAPWSLEEGGGGRGRDLNSSASSRSQALRAEQVACQAGRKHYGPSRLLAKQVASTTGRKHYGPSRLQEWRAGEGGRGGNAHPFMPSDDV